MFRSFLLVSAVSLLPALQQQGCDYDSDYDGTDDSEDNCEEIYNPNQSDEDGDGIGDACDSRTPYHEMNVAGCYLSNWPPLRGVNWEDRPTYIQQGDIDPTQLLVSVDWTSSDSDWIESGEGTTTGVDLWFDIRDEHNPYNWTKTITEGAINDSNGDGEGDEIAGTYVMFSCTLETGCYYESDYEYFTDGEWNAVKTNSLDCAHID